MKELKNNSNGFFTDDKFHRLLEAGKVGEAIIMPMLSYACKCWRYPMEMANGWVCPHAPTVIDKTDDTEFQKALDIDAQLHFSCDNCPVYDFYNDRAMLWDKAEIDQWHEIKTNYATHGESKEENSIGYTQNIAIETVEWLQKLKKFKRIGIDAEREKPKGEKNKKFSALIGECVRADPRFKHSTIFNTPGAGWYYKALKHYSGIPRTKASIQGEPLLADWYHFYQRIQAADGYKVAEATQEEIDKWLNDDNVPRGSLLITQYPFSYCISISGSYLKKLVRLYTKEVEYGKPEKRQKAKLIPIADLIPCHVYKGADLMPDVELSAETGERWNSEEMRLFISGDCGRVKRTPAGGSMEGQRYYIPRRLIEETEKVYPVRGGKVIAVAPQKEVFKRKYSKYDWKYSDTYLIPKMFALMAALAERY